ncbi:CCA tRNA nucleotidyltransferase [Sulfurimonas sp. SAG-AH-194-L11]|nr:CCA tRNA nucleotidyltransferase [Sulfurimonas sp. SAG-AH-194-L11]MDF1876342.1 CCA tRNA nucleotidyltransferase [Sulfurimonas sp. SAG-AH-194-L11]
MFDYPNKLNIIFDKLYTFGIKPIIVGGYVRDYILHLDSKDIDIELYGLDSLEVLENILTEFGNVNSVGKSFGVCKLHFDDLELDFSLPREDSKISAGHKGFSVVTDKNLDFKTAASRRDFTINAMGYDVKEKKLLDPFNGLQDIDKKILRAVDINKFAEDPLRVLRAIQFSSRFNFKLDEKLLSLLKRLIETNILTQLPKERIFQELQKMFLKSSTPSIGLHLLKKLKLLEYFSFCESYKQVDYFAQHKVSDNNINTLIFLALVYTKEHLSSLQQLTNKQKLHTNLILFLDEKEHFDIDDDSNYALYSLASRVDIESFLLYMDAYYAGSKKDTIAKLKKKAKALHILHKKLPALLQGKDLIDFGLSPSKEFSHILLAGYEAQMRGVFSTIEEAREWLQTYNSLSFIGNN